MTLCFLDGLLDCTYVVTKVVSHWMMGHIIVRTDYLTYPNYSIYTTWNRASQSGSSMSRSSRCSCRSSSVQPPAHPYPRHKICGERYPVTRIASCLSFVSYSTIKEVHGLLVKYIVHIVWSSSNCLSDAILQCEVVTVCHLHVHP